MPSISSFESLSRSGVDLISDEGFRYNKYDSLATVADLSALFEVISSAKDSTGRSFVMTPFAMVANPDFDKIRDYGFTKYFFEPFIDTLKRYPGCEDSFSLWKEGIVKRLFVPQFHGREHLNVISWMKALGLRHELTMKAFDHRLWGVSTAGDPDIGLEFQAAFDFVDRNDLVYHKEVLTEGLALFEDLFGFRATCFVPPNGQFSSDLEKTCNNEGIKLLILPRVQAEPAGGGVTRKNIHWTGQKSSTGLSYVTRNALFEPCMTGRDWVESCLYDISASFRWRKPAIISSHRVNFVGSLYEQNRKNGLSQLQLLLNRIIKEWPDVEFITSGELAKIMYYAG
jgi:hypothetical protein